ncbi:MAG: hypothetical protein ACPG5U_03430 [Planktomarina sp.]
MIYDLKFDIPDDLYKRAVTQPITPARRKAAKWKEIRNFFAVIAFFVAGYFFGTAFFPNSHPLAVPFGSVFGAALVLIIWWRQHFAMVRLHRTYNDSAGLNHIILSAEKVIAMRPSIRTEMEWSFVKTVWAIDGATLIDLGTARLIVPDTALPSEVLQPEFLAQLQAWKDVP